MGVLVSLSLRTRVGYRLSGRTRAGVPDAPALVPNASILARIVLGRWVRCRRPNHRSTF